MSRYLLVQLSRDFKSHSGPSNVPVSTLRRQSSRSSLSRWLNPNLLPVSVRPATGRARPDPTGQRHSPPAPPNRASRRRNRVSCTGRERGAQTRSWPRRGDRPGGGEGRGGGRPSDARGQCRGHADTTSSLGPCGVPGRDGRGGGGEDAWCCRRNAPPYNPGGGWGGRVVGHEVLVSILCRFYTYRILNSGFSEGLMM